MAASTVSQERVKKEGMTEPAGTRPFAPLPPPGAVHELAERAVEFVRRAVGIVLDYSPETLPILDHYLRAVPDDQLETVALLAAPSGAYFGEVARRRLGGEWDENDPEPSRWDLVLPGDLRLQPCAFAREAILTTDTGEAIYDVPPEHVEAVEDALEARGPVAEDEYYSLCGRVETMQLILDVLHARRAASVASAAPVAED
jgi:hypothetical protein